MLEEMVCVSGWRGIVFVCIINYREDQIDERYSFLNYLIKGHLNCPMSSLYESEIHSVRKPFEFERGSWTILFSIYCYVV